MSNNLGVVIIGAGNIGHRHAVAINRVDQMELLGFYDSNPGFSEERAAQHKVKSFHSLEEVLKASHADIIDLCTPPATHTKIAVQALRSEKHVIVEKPFTLELGDVVKIEAIAKKKKRKIGAIAQHRYGRDALRLKEMMDRGLDEQIRSVSMKVQRNRSKEYLIVSKDNWKSQRNMAGGGVLLTIGFHYLDLLCWFVGKEPKVIDCTYRKQIDGIESSILGKFQLGAIPCEVDAKYGEEVPNQQDKLVFKTTNQEIVFQGDRLQKNSANENPDRYALHARQLEDFAASILDDRRPMVMPNDTKTALALVFNLYQYARNK